MNISPNMYFSFEQFEQIFPFFILFSKDMEIMAVGKSLKKLAPNSLQQSAQDFLHFKRPSFENPSFETLKNYANQLAVLNLAKRTEIALRGEFIFLPQTEQLLFLGSPWFESVEMLTEAGLILSDFAIHDAIIDLLHIMKTQEIANQDTKELLNTVTIQKNELYKLSMIVQETFNPVIITDAAGDIEWVNKSFEKLTGYRLKEILKLRPGMILQGEETDPETVAYLRERIRQALPFQCDIVNYTKDKRPYWISIMGQPVFNKKGELTNFFAIEEDITERKLTEQKLRYSEEKYRSIIENMELGLLEVDNDGLIVRPFARFCELTGYEAEEIIGKDALTFFVPTEYHPILIQQAQDRHQGKAGTYEIPLIHKNGSWIWVLISGAPIYNERGDIKGSIGIHYNLTERKTLEEKLAHAKKVAEDARQTEQQFLANMSHEIRTPLNAIIGMSHLLYDTRPTPEQKEYIDILNNSANFLHSLISNILDMAKIEAGKIELNPRPFDLIGIVSTLQKTFQMKLEGRPIEVEAMIDSRIKGLYVGDETTLHQILMNLLGNADKFTEKGTISLSVKQAKKEEDKVWIEFKVADTGIGISEENLPMIFQKFKQVQNEKGEKYKGTGLGLSIVKELIDLHGGIISVSSKKGEGTCFTFILPFEHTSESLPIAQTISTPLEGADFSGASFLVVEDNIMNRKYLGSLLEKKQITFDVAIDGLEAIRKAGQKKYDLILMDIQMPNMNGYEAALNIRSTQNLNTQTPIIALTASAMLDQKNKAFEVGMDDYISKPFTPQQLFEKLSIFLTPRPKNLEKSLENEIPFSYHHELDVPYLTELYADDYEYALSMYQTFIDEMLPEFVNLQQYTNLNQTAQLAKLAHQLKPTAAMVGLTQLEKSLFALESLASQENNVAQDLLHATQQVMTQLEQKREALMQQYEALKAHVGG